MREFDLLDPLQGLIPATLQFVGYQTVLRIRGIVLLLGTLRRIAGRFQLSSPGVQDVVLLAVSSSLANTAASMPQVAPRAAPRWRWFRLAQAHRMQYNAVAHCPRRAPTTSITEHIMVVASVQHGELTTTPPTAQQTGQQGGTGVYGARWSAPANVFRDRLLNLLILFPTHVARMRVGRKASHCSFGLRRIPRWGSPFS